MKCYLQKGYILNPAAPTFDPADLAQVISLGNSIIAVKNIAMKPIIFKILIQQIIMLQKLFSYILIPAGSAQTMLGLKPVEYDIAL